MTTYPSQNETSLPTFTDYVDQRFLIEPLSGPEHPRNYLDRFPEEVYHKGPETHLVRFLYSLIGPAGVGWINKQYFDMRLQLEAAGIRLFNLDAFYGDPFGFGRVASEIYPEADPRGILPQSDWEAINTADERYRSRALDFMNAARAGTTPLGMRLASRSGINHEVEVIENYFELFDNHSDDPVGFPRYGRSESLQEFIVVPRRELTTSVEQTIVISNSPTGGEFYLSYNGQVTDALAHDAEYWQVQGALQGLSSIGPDGCLVSGGPAPDNPFVVTFTGRLSAKDVPLIQGAAAFTTADATITVTSAISRKQPYQEETYITADEKHTLYAAVEKLKPMTAIPTLHKGRGRTVNIDWANSASSSEMVEVVRYVTGSDAVVWPTETDYDWVRANQELEVPRTNDDFQFHYQGFHDIDRMWAYTGNALQDDEYSDRVWSVRDYPSEHVGIFHREQRKLEAFSYLRRNDDDELRFRANRIEADYAEPLTVTTQSSQGTSDVALVNGMYPATYSELAGIPTVRYRDEQFWASRERTQGSDYIELDFGKTVAINFMSFDISRKPIDIEIAYDVLDQYPRREWQNVTPTYRFPNRILHDSRASSPWYHADFHFGDSLRQIIYTRGLRIKFTRYVTDSQGFLTTYTDAAGNYRYRWPWSIDVKNLRVGRNVSNY